MEEEGLSWTAFGYGQQLTAISDDTNNERMRTKKRLLYQKIYYLMFLFIIERTDDQTCLRGSICINLFFAERHENFLG